MILVRLVFQAKFGKAGAVVAGWQGVNQAYARESNVGGQGWRALTGRGWRILTDLSGPFDTVIVEYEAESLAEWEGARQRMMTKP